MQKEFCSLRKLLDKGVMLWKKKSIDTFIDGLVNNNQLTMKILRDDSNTLQGGNLYCNKGIKFKGSCKSLQFFSPTL